MSGVGASEPPSRVAVVGAGLIGGSVALAARAAGCASVLLTDRDPAVLARARALGLPGATEVLADAIADAELVVIAVPAAAVVDVAVAVVRTAPEDAVLTDVAGLKAALVADVESALRAAAADPARFVGGHPMAGSERSGPEAADARLFQAAPWVLTPTASTGDDSLARVRAFVAALGARVLVLGARRHDELVTVVSHLPQFVASALVDVAADSVDDVDALLAVAGTGFRDTTRVAASDAGPWADLVAHNADALADRLATFAARVSGLAAAIRDGRTEEVEALLDRASQARRRLVPKADVEGVDLVVPLRDEPGSLAAATRALGEAGVNVEDLSMRHASHADVGALIVRVRADALERATTALAAAGIGWRIGDERGWDA